MIIQNPIYTCIGPRRRTCSFTLATTGSSSLGMRGMEQAARKHSTCHALLQQPARSCGRVLAEPSGWRCLWSHWLWRVGPKRLAATSGYAYELVGFARHRSQAESSDSSSARGSSAQRQAQVQARLHHLQLASTSDQKFRKMLSDVDMSSGIVFCEMWSRAQT